MYYVYISKLLAKPLNSCPVSDCGLVTLYPNLPFPEDRNTGTNECSLATRPNHTKLELLCRHARTLLSPSASVRITLHFHVQSSHLCAAEFDRTSSGLDARATWWGWWYPWYFLLSRHSRRTSSRMPSRRSPENRRQIADVCLSEVLGFSYECEVVKKLNIHIVTDTARNQRNGEERTGCSSIHLFTLLLHTVIT